MKKSFLSAWLKDDARACAFLGAGVRSAAERAAHVHRAAQRTISPALADALRAFDAQLPKSAARRANLDALANGGVAAIVTGQQAGLFLGPLFTFYKAATAIVLARALQEETGVRCVPVFWLQVEDHDFVEINHTYLPGPLKVGLPDDDRRMSIAHRDLDASIDDAVALLERELGPLPHAAEFLAHVRSAYRPGRNMATAFAELLAYCFADEGLVFLDPRQPAILALTTPILRRSVREIETIDAALLARSAELEDAGFAAQVPVRAGSPLAFHHPAAATGPRYRAQKSGDAWTLIGADGTVTSAALEEAEPGRLSSSALLRPLIQDSLLPTAAYVGGPGELAYFAQLAPLYRHFGLVQPAFALRARLRCVDPTTRSLLERVGLRAEDIEAPRDQLLARIVQSDLPTPERVADELLRGFHERLDTLLETVPSLDENLRGPITATRDTVDRAVARLVERYGRARIDKDRVAQERIDRLQAILFPLGEPQERVLGLPYFACKYGLAEWKAAVLSVIRPFDPTIVEVTP